MSDALLVLNAGSSSLKFSVFLNEDPPRPLLRGQLEGLLTQPRFIARRGATVLGEKRWPSGTELGHQGAIEFLFAWGREGALDGHRIIAAGHRVVHGGMKFTAPVLIDAETLAELECLVPLAPLHQPHNVAAIKAVAQIGADPAAGCMLRYRLSPHAADRLRGRSPCRAAMQKKVCGVTAFTVYLTNTSLRCCRRVIVARPMGVLW